MSGADTMLRSTIEKYFGTSTDETESVLASLRPVDIEGGDWLFRQGDPGDSLYFLVRGRLQVWVKPEGAPEDAMPTLLGEVLPGGSVGEISLLTGARRTAGVRAIRRSQLVGVDRAEFAALARRHPALGMRLAGSVASVLRSRTSRSASVAGSFRTLAVVRIGDSDRVRAFCTELGEALAGHGTTLSPSPEVLGKLGAPVATLNASDPVPRALADWLHDQESAHRFLAFQCEADDSPWSIYVVQQSDLVLFVADALADPVPASGEAALCAECDEASSRRALVLLQPASSTPITGTATWLNERRVDFHLHVRADQPDDLARVARVISGNAVGLVLGAGAARGLAHLGVYKAMEEAGIRPDWVGGASMGAIMGAVVAKGWGADKAIKQARAAFSGPNPFGDYALPLVGLLRGRRFDRLLREYLPGRIEDLPDPFYAVSCNLDSGSMNLHESGSLPDALRASAAMPGVMPPAVVNQQLAIDGAVLSSMPVDIMQTKPVGRIFAVDLSTQRTYLVPFTSVPSPWAILRGRLLPFFPKYRVPSLMTLLLKATEVGTLARVRELGKSADLLLSPPVREFGMMDLKSYDRIVDAGYQYAKVALAEWQAKQNSRGSTP